MKALDHNYRCCLIWLRFKILSSGLRKTFVWIWIWIHQKLAPNPDLTLKENFLLFWLLKETWVWIRIRSGFAKRLDPDPDLIIPGLQLRKY